MNKDRDNKTRLSYWFPKIKEAGLPVPRTTIVQAAPRVEAAIYEIFDGREPHPDDREDLDSFVAKLQRVAEGYGLPVFLRTDLTSGKHSWLHTCYVEDAALMEKHVLELAFYSVSVDIFGIPFDTYVVREFLPIQPYGTAFLGMPVNREFRFFVRDGVVEGFQPYWPLEALEAGGNNDIDYDRLATLRSPEEFGELRQLSERAGEAVGGYWSVDILETKDGWYVTDMAEGERSYKDPKGYVEL